MSELFRYEEIRTGLRKIYVESTEEHTLVEKIPTVEQSNDSTLCLS